MYIQCIKWDFSHFWQGLYLPSLFSPHLRSETQQCLLYKYFSFFSVCKSPKILMKRKMKLSDPFSKIRLHLKPHEVFKNTFISKSYHNISQFSNRKNFNLLSSTKKASLSSSLDIQMKSWKENYLKCWEETKSSYVLTNLENCITKLKNYGRAFPFIK